MMGLDDGMVNPVVGEVLSAQIYAEVPELARHLRLQLEVGRIAALVIKLATTIQLTSHVELPKFERCLIRESEQTFVAGCERFLAQHTIMVSGGRIGTQVECAPADLIKVTRGKTAAITQEHQA